MADFEIPAALRPYAKERRWVVWRYEENKSGKPTKMLYQPDHPELRARSNDPSTWSDLDTALEVVESDGFEGVGMELLDGEIAAIDVDDCRDGDSGEIDPIVMELVARFNTYTEITPSRTGLRIIGNYMDEPKKQRNAPVGTNGASIELYPACVRFITVTGDHLGGTPDELTDITDLINEVMAELDKPKGGGSTRQQSDASPLPNHIASLLSVTGSGSYPSRSELLFAFINLALKAGVADQAIVDACLDGAHSGCGIYEHCRENGGEQYVKRQMEHVANATAIATGDKWAIKVHSGFRHETWRATQRAMLDKGCQVFVRGGALVEPLWRWDEHEGRGTLVMRFVRYNLARLSDQAARHAAEFYRYDVRAKKDVRIDPPKDVIEALLTRGDWEFPTARGIINTPTLRRDGSLLSTPGYDKTTGLWYKPPLNFAMPPVPEKPTKADALAALGLINGLLDEFPLVDDMARSVALAALMTPVLRGAYTVAPLFFIDKPAAGTGGSYLADLCSCVATGRVASPLKTSEDPKELVKELSAAALEGGPILNLNNLTFDLESGDLCQMVTEGTLKIRPFGKNDELKECDCRAMTIYANGNNIRIVGDLVRRTVTCRLDAKMELPELRTFQRRPVDEVLADRGKFLAAIFTIAGAYKLASANNPKIAEAKSVAGFEEWSKWVACPLIWLGWPDPFDSQEGLRAMNPEHHDRRARIEALVNHIGKLGSEFSAADIYQVAMVLDPSTMPAKMMHQDLFDAFLSKNNNRLSVQTISKFLIKDLHRRTKDDYHLELATKDRKTNNTYQMFLGDEPMEIPKERL